MKNTIATILFGAVCAAFAWSVQAQKPAPAPAPEVRTITVTDTAAVDALEAKLASAEAELRTVRAELAAAKESAARPKAVPVLAAKPTAYYTTRSSSGCAGGSCSSRGTARRGPPWRRR